ncbi:MAG: hypothetical protein ACOY0T_05850 [Myxococcota bacterium]
MQRFTGTSYRAKHGVAALATVGWCTLMGIAGLGGCGSEDSEQQGGAGEAGASQGAGGAVIGSGGAAGGSSTALGGVANVGGTTAGGGAKSAGGATATGGAMSGGGGVAGGSNNVAGTMAAAGSTGMQPLGAICANDGNCSQAQGAAVCCRSTCTLAEECTNSTYLPCDSGADCAAYGGGKSCCEQQASGQTIRFCTKQSACTGKVLP